MASKFVHLHTHSHYSLLDGLAKIDQLIEKAVEYEMPALALTDHGNLYGVIEFYKKCRKAGIKPIIGVEAYLAFESLEQKRPKIDSKRYHIVLLAQNETGYKNLIKLVTTANLKGFYYKPRIDKELLRRHSEGIIGLSACMAGELSRAVEAGDFEEAVKLAAEYEDIFGKGNFFIEIMHHPNIENFQKIQEGLVEVARRAKVPLVATQDIHYIYPEDNEAHDVLVAIQRNENLNDTNREVYKKEDFSFRSGELMAELFKNLPEAVKNTLEIAERCSLELELGKWVFPKFEIPTGEPPELYLSKLCEQGYKKKIGQEKDKSGEAFKRMKYELDVINKKGYAPYFLVVSDIIRWAKGKGIITTTRGSAAGSLVSYLIDITNINPVEYELPFERFLNPYRPSPPDIDMDFADDRRDEVIEYAKEKYGRERVAQIGTFGTMMARAAVRDVARALGKPYELGDRIAKNIPLGSQGFPMTIQKALDISPELREIYESDEEAKRVIDLARKIEGGARHISVHAAGVVISPSDLTDFVPLQTEPNGDKIITQYDMHAVEEAGLLKFDFLGIRNLSILGNTVKLVKKIHGEEIDLANINLDDKKTFEMLSRGETEGVFQLSGSGMTRWLKELKPTNILDLMAMIALFRPGPMANIPTYIKRKHGKEPVTYLDPRLEKILGKTYGVITYQEDVLLIAIELAGYDWQSVDKFRKAIGKKIPEEMAKQEKIFIEGCQKHGGLTQEKAEELWRLFDPFKGYGFNKAHAASYAMVAYQTAYMKANYPVEFMASVLSSEAGDTDKVAATVAECRRMKIPVLPPDINESFGNFTVVFGEDGKKAEAIRFGLYSIKNLGEAIANAIIEERKKNGPFKSFADFLERIRHKDLNKKSLEALIKSGSMDALGERNELLYNIDTALEYNRQIAKQNTNQTSLFGLVEDKSSLPGLRLKETKKLAFDEKLLWEKELLGLYISGHPLDKHKDKLQLLKMDIKKARGLTNNFPVVLGGMIEEIRKVLTKQNEPMLFIKFSDYESSIELVIFPRVLEQYGDIIKEGNCIAVKGRISLRNGEPAVIAEQLKEMKEKK